MVSAKGVGRKLASQDRPLLRVIHCRRGKGKSVTSIEITRYMIIRSKRGKKSYLHGYKYATEIGEEKGRKRCKVRIRVE